MNAKTIIFDFDGTIADSFEFVTDFLVSQAGKAKLNDKELQMLKSVTMRSMAQKIGNPWWRLVFLLFAGQRAMARHIDEIQPSAGIIPVIMTLHEQGYALYVVSSNKSRTIRRFLKAHEIDAYFTTVRGSVGLRGKTHALKKLIHERGLDSKTCIYVGDESSDVSAAKKVGLSVLAVTWGFMNKEALESSEPAALVEKPEDILALLAPNDMLV